MSFKINIAIDGPAASGKSAAASLLAEKINYDLMDTGIIYRSFTNYCLKNHIPFDNKNLLLQALQTFTIEWINGHFLFNGQPASEEIYSTEVTSKVPFIASISEIRSSIVATIQQLVVKKGFIVVGRDITSVVLPDAELKIFLTSNLHARSMRRYYQYLQEGIDIKAEDVYNDMVKRDNLDKTRTTGQLIIVKDAIVIDNSDFDLPTTVTKLVHLYNKYLANNIKN